MKMNALFVPLVFATTITVVLLFLLGVLLLHKKQGLRIENMDTDNSLDGLFIWPRVVYDEDLLFNGSKIIVDNDCDEDGRFAGDDCDRVSTTQMWNWINFDGLHHGRLEDEVEDDKDDDDADTDDKDTDDEDEEPPLFVNADNDCDDDCDGLTDADDDCDGLTDADDDCDGLTDADDDVCDTSYAAAPRVLSLGLERPTLSDKRVEKCDRSCRVAEDFRLEEEHLTPRAISLACMGGKGSNTAADVNRACADMAARLVISQHREVHEQIDRSHGQHQPHLHCADGG